ncbi:MAG: phospholipase [Planctomycetes bacterium]|nr:phospholipase [Planctomycetota bacterium]
MISTALLLLLALAPQAPSIELVESFPLETSLDNADIRDADVVWREMIDGAQKTLDFAQFYASDKAGSKLGAIISAIERAGARGVKVRFLAEKKFQVTYPDTLLQLGAMKNVEVRLYDIKALTGGILHAKYFLVDSSSTYIGSQNFDWRSFEHIQELGVYVRSPEATTVWQSIFEADWAIAGGAKAADVMHASGARTAQIPLGAGDAETRITPVASPAGLLPDPSAWDLPQLISLIENAKQSVRLQLLTYKMSSRNEYFGELEGALRGAAARGVTVQLLVADWCMRKGTIEGLQSLEPLANVEVKLVTIPQWSQGYVSYGRVIHSKYMVVDGTNAWIGTSNWERDYFYQSRNVGLIVQGGAVPKRLEAYFATGWTSPYAKAVDPCAQYTPPTFGD